MSSSFAIVAPSAGGALLGQPAIDISDPAPRYAPVMALMNLDAGEYPDEPEELWAMFDVLNIACGGHAGDAASMDKVVGFCARAGVTVGAHPSYPDRENFGRKTMAIEAEALAAAIGAQCEALAE